MILNGPVNNSPAHFVRLGGIKRFLDKRLSSIILVDFVGSIDCTEKGLHLLKKRLQINYGLFFFNFRHDWIFRMLLVRSKNLQCCQSRLKWWLFIFRKSYLEKTNNSFETIQSNKTSTSVTIKKKTSDNFHFWLKCCRFVKTDAFFKLWLVS